MRIKNADIQSGRIANPPERVANPPERVYIEVEWTDLESSYSIQAIANMPKRTVTPINTTNAISLIVFKKFYFLYMLCKLIIALR